MESASRTSGLAMVLTTGMAAGRENDDGIGEIAPMNLAAITQKGGRNRAGFEEE